MENNPEYLAEKEEFYKYFERVIVPSVRNQENKRKKYLALFTCICLLVVAWIVLLVMGVIPFVYKGEFGFFICILVLGVCAPMFLYYKQSKENILPVIIGYFGQFTYLFRPELSEQILSAGRIMRKYDKLTTDDGFEGNYDEIPVKITEYTLFDYKKRKKDNVEMMVAEKKDHGIIFSAKMNKDFQGQTIVVKDKGIFNKLARYKGLMRIGLESPEFEKAYEVYSDNQIEARYILTTVMLEYMLELKKIFPKIEYSFFDNQLQINIEMKENFFECSSFFRSVINKKRIEKIFKQLYLLFSIVKTLHLNEKRLL